MPLPDLIEMVPLDKPVVAEITVPGSKSITNRALVLAALAHGEVTLRGALWSEDTQVMVDCLQRLGFDVRVELDPKEFCNRTITVLGRGGEVPNQGTDRNPLDLFVGNAGTAARFLAAMVCLGQGVYRLSGVPRMHQRPQAALFGALRQLGYGIEAETDKLPVIIRGNGPQEGRCRVSIEESSQFASALLLGSGAGRWQVEIVGENAEESPYVAMTLEMIKSFPRNTGTFQIEPDASSGSYFWGASALIQTMSHPSSRLDPFLTAVTVRSWPQSTWQFDTAFPKFIPLPERVSRRDDLGDSIMTAITLAPNPEMRGHGAPERIDFVDLGRLRVQECERVSALKTELRRCGARVDEHDDTLSIFPGPLHGAEIETYQDHRMAMCFAVLGLKVPGIRIRNPGCVKKTFPNFFQKLGAGPPHGLGVKILDGHTSHPLARDELFAD